MMIKMTIICEAIEADNGLRIDVYLTRCRDDMSRSALAHLIESGGVTLNGKPVRKNHRVSAGERFVIELPEPTVSEAVPQDIPLDVVFEDGDVIVVNKPRGMVTHPATGNLDGTLVNALLAHCAGSLSGIGGVLRPGIVHRLDKDTSGLIIAAKNDMAHASLAAQIKARTVLRQYEAVVFGNIRQDDGTVDAPIGRHRTDRKRMAVTDMASRPAVTHYRVLARAPGWTHVQCTLQTGRTHQIRVHMAHIGHPVAGDPVYGHKKSQLSLDSQCLHARRLAFDHPASGERVELETELPPYFMEILKRLGF